MLGALAISFIPSGIGRLIKKPSTKKIIFFILFSSFISFSSTYTYAGRPLSTDDAWTVEKGKFQLEMGFDATRQENHDRRLSPSLTLSHGLSERMDLGIGSGYFFAHPKQGKKESGLADTELKAKYRWMDEKGWIPAFGISGKLKIPTASKSKGLGSGQADFRINAIATKNLSKRCVFQLNLGYTFIGEDHGDNEFNYSLAGQFIATERWTLLGEIIGMNNLNGRKGDDPLSGLIGTCYLITHNVIWDTGLEIRISKAAPNFRFTTGLTLLFKP